MSEARAQSPEVETVRARAIRQAGDARRQAAVEAAAKPGARPHAPPDPRSDAPKDR